MNDTMKLTLQLTAVDMLSGVLSVVNRHIQSLGESGKKVQRDFEVMSGSITRGLKAIAVASYAAHKAMGGIHAAGDLQEAMIDVKMDLMRSGQAAADLNTKLAQVRSTAVSIQAVTPFSSQDVVEVEGTLMKAGLHMKDVVGKGGAAWAASALATITHTLPNEMAEALVHTAVPFHITGEGYGALADQLQRVATAGGTKVPDLMEGMKYVAGQAASMRVDLQDVLTSMGVLSKAGLEGGVAGESLNHFLIMLNGATPESRKYMHALGITAYNAQGHIKPMIDIINQLRQSFSRLTDQQKQMAALKMFGLRGERVANALLNTGDYGFEGITEHMKEEISLQEKMDERMKGFNANVQALKTTWQSTLATMYGPFLNPLTKGLQLLNDIAAKMGEIGEKHKALTSVFSGSLAAGAVAAGGFGIYELGKGVGAGSRVLKGIGGLKGLLKGVAGTGAGIAEGKAVQAATGVTPVFVTNWPGTSSAAALPETAARTGFEGAAAAAGAGGLLGWLKKVPAAVKGLPTVLAGGVGAAGTGMTAALVAITAGVGYAVGTGINLAMNKATAYLSEGKEKTVADAWYDMTHPAPGSSKQESTWDVLKETGRGAFDAFTAFANRRIIEEKPLARKDALPSTTLNKTLGQNIKTTKDITQKTLQEKKDVTSTTVKKTLEQKVQTTKDITQKSLQEKKDVPSTAVNKTLAQITETMKNITHNVLPSSIAGVLAAPVTGLNWLINKASAFMSGGKENSLGALVYDLVHMSQVQPHPFKMPEVKNNIALQITIDDRGRTITKTTDPNTRVTINSMKRGVQTND